MKMFRNRLYELAARINVPETVELGIKTGVLRNGMEWAIRTPKVPGQPGSHYPKMLIFRDPGSKAAAVVEKKSGRLADWGLLQSDYAKHGTHESAASLRKLLPLARNLKKNKSEIDFIPHPMSKKGVTSADKLRKSYVRIARRVGYKPHPTIPDRLVP